MASWLGAWLRSARIVGATFVFVAGLGCTSTGNDPLFGGPTSGGVGGAGGACTDAPPADGSIDDRGATTGDNADGNEAGDERGGADGNTDALAGEAGPGADSAADGAREAEAGPVCGNESQDCCPGARCTAPFTFCGSGKCMPCGAWGTACCPDFGCRDLGCCSNGVCVSNGGNCEMQPSANLCTNGACRDCGAPGSVCCGSQVRTCQQGLACTPALVADQCVACGAAGQSCCGLAASPFCNGDLVCNRARQCQQCGIVNAPCCPTGNACGPSMVCDPNRTCQRCGTATELCCMQAGQSVCDFGFTCTAAGRCTPCGAVGQICCENRTCTGGGACVRGGAIESCYMGCGARGQPCCNVPDCPNGQCDGCLFGLDCDLTLGQCIGP